ncbi:S-adenosylmethionine:tRNA ribosyltransferase-isomerase, partial [Bacillus altitudinis]|uniref:S-adenosylmethionine:tRNA ribosyltransferase-isomerase n=1 Tax=Bacillus altitudinis TaxID=293387 RepID=UPI003B516804
MKHHLHHPHPYQTLYSKHLPSPPPPTPPLHFTNQLLHPLKPKPLHIPFITLHLPL